MNKARLFAITTALLLVGVIFVFAHSYVTAQSAGQGLEVSPPSQEVSINPGSTTIVKAKIRNKGNNTLPIQVHIEDFTAKGDDGQVELTTNSPYSVVNWTRVSPSSFTLEPG